MRKKTLKLVENSYNYKNVVFLGPAPHNSIKFERVRADRLSPSQKKRVVTYEACKNKHFDGRNTGCKSCRHVCVMAVVRRTEEGEEMRILELKEIFPNLKM